ncbi:MAG: cytochrome c biogenesis protein ResB, partial [bacterium]|nr:cytochrome c biogenesis protein ResB [bacterium]
GLLVGMFWDQTLSLAEQLEFFPNSSFLAGLFVFFEGYDVFHSWWFSIVILILALNLTACSIQRLPQIWIEIHNPERVLTDQLFKKLPLKFQTEIATNKAYAFVEQLLPPGRFTQTIDNINYYYFEKHKYARTGVYIVHIALLMIMFGSILATNLGIDGMMMIVEGEVENTVRVKGPGGLAYQHQLGFNLKCDDFRLKTFVDGSPMDFESDLTLIDANEVPPTTIKQTIKVNQPLQHKGYTFYQASYQPMPSETQIKLMIAPHGETGQAHFLAIGEKMQMPDGDAFIPMEIMEDYGGLGAAVKIKQIKSNGQSTSFVVFRQYPDFDKLVRRDKWNVYFQGFDQVYATGVSVGKVPYIQLVFGGFCVMFVGLFMAFYMSHRRYFFRIKRLSNDNCELLISGIARRHAEAFAEEFKQITDRIK